MRQNGILTVKKYYTSAYDCIMVKGNDGNFYEITIFECDDIKGAAEKYTDIWKR